MGCTCCCMRDDWEEYTDPNSSVYRHCICLHCFIESFSHMYNSVFRRDVEALPSDEGSSPSASSVSSLDSSLSDMFRSPPRPLPYDVDPRVLRMNREKGCSNSNEESESLMTASTKLKGSSTCEDKSKEFNSRSSVRFSSATVATGFIYNYSSSEDEDVCPTCFEEYTTENPKIVTHCSHHYHLGCIYEWMERSENCPVCGKVMSFDETT